jgi:hypothetical protein
VLLLKLTLGGVIVMLDWKELLDKEIVLPKVDLDMFKKFDVKVELPKNFVSIESLEYVKEVTVNSGKKAKQYRVKFVELPVSYYMNVVDGMALVVPLPIGSPTMSKRSEDNLWTWHQAFYKAYETGAMKELLDQYLNQSREAM